jgi:hypothetical protein
MASVGGAVARDDWDNLGIVAPLRINSRPVQSMQGRSAMQEPSQLLKHRVGVEKGTKAVISVNFSVYGERTFNDLRTNFVVEIL